MQWMGWMGRWSIWCPVMWFDSTILWCFCIICGRGRWRWPSSVTFCIEKSAVTVSLAWVSSCASCRFRVSYGDSINPWCQSGFRCIQSMICFQFAWAKWRQRSVCLRPNELTDAFALWTKSFKAYKSSRCTHGRRRSQNSWTESESE